MTKNTIKKKKHTKKKLKNQASKKKYIYKHNKLKHGIFSYALVYIFIIIYNYKFKYYYNTTVFFNIDLHR